MYKETNQTKYALKMYEKVAYLCPIMKRTMIPFSFSNLRSCSPDQITQIDRYISYIRRRIYFIGDLHQNKERGITLRHPSLSNGIPSLPTTESRINSNYHKCLLLWRPLFRCYRWPLGRPLLLNTPSGCQLHLKDRHWLFQWSEHSSHYVILYLQSQQIYT